MKHLSHKTMSVMAWVVVVLQALSLLLTIRYFLTITIILSLLAIGLQAVIAFTMKDEHASQKRMFILAVVFCVLDLSIPSVLLLGMILVKRFAKNTGGVSKLWMIPCLAAAIIQGINLGTSLGYGYATSSLLVAGMSFVGTLLQYYVIGYWYFNNAADRSARDNEKVCAARNKQLTYYGELYQQGAITEEEWKQKQAEYGN